jgi:hypothetical protein
VEQIFETAFAWGDAMKKIPTIFKRNPENMREVTADVHPDCQWVFQGEGVATRKYDGTCVKIEEGKCWKRREVKKDKRPPVGFIEVEFDVHTGKRVGWVEVDPSAKEDRWHMEAFDPDLLDGTYELVGPKVQGNPERYVTHVLVKHSEAERYQDVPRSLDGLKEWLADKDIEGLVFHHPDGRMGKIKKRDFGLERK